MSGGSFNYLCLKESEDYLSWEVGDQLRRMAEELTSIGADDAAAETEEIIAALAQMRRRLDVRRKRLNPLWRAVEWWRSGDWGREDVDRALAEYRGSL